MSTQVTMDAVRTTNPRGRERDHAAELYLEEGLPIPPWQPLPAAKEPAESLSDMDVPTLRKICS